MMLIKVRTLSLFVKIDICITFQCLNFQLLVLVDGACRTGYKLEFDCFHPVEYIHNFVRLSLPVGKRLED